MRPTRFTALLALLLAAASAQAAPLRLGASGHFLTPVMVNGAGPYNFIVDTCAAGSVIYPQVRDGLHLTALAGHQANVQGASGRVAASLFRLTRIDVAGRTRGPLTAVGLESVGAGTPDLAGVVGVDQMSGYVVEFDAPAGQIRFDDAATDLTRLPNGPSWAALPVQFNGPHFPVLQGTIDGRPVTILFDTGARRSVINWAAARALGVAPGDPDLQPTEPIRGATADRTVSVKRDFRSIRIAGLTVPANEMTIADLPVFRGLGLGDRPVLLLGMDRMRAYRFAVDYPRSRILVAQPAR